jgi:CheY-like chemotaxis protein
MNTIIFIDDDKAIRDTYEISMNLMFNGEFHVVCLDVQASLKDMMTVLDDYPDKVSYFVDENLKYSGVATYTGIELIDEIRKIDTKIPIYILSSAADDIDNLIGNIEFVIDKNDWEDEDREDDLKQRFYRHINTYKDIKSAQARKFDELFEKSLFSTLSEEELNEFNALNLGRSKKLVDEKLISEESLMKLNETSAELDTIYKELTKDDD